MKKLMLILAALIVTQIMGCATTSSSGMASAGADLPEIAPYDDPAIPPLDVEEPPVEPMA